MERLIRGVIKDSIRNHDNGLYSIIFGQREGISGIHVMVHKHEHLLADIVRDANLHPNGFR